MAYKSERTKKLEEAKVDKDMPGIKGAVKSTAVGISRAIDKVEGLFKKDEEPKKKMAKGGYAAKGKKKMAAGGAATKAKAQKKVGAVMKEFKEGTLHSGKGGKVVTNPKQAIAISLSEAGISKKKKK